MTAPFPVVGVPVFVMDNLIDGIWPVFQTPVSDELKPYSSETSQNLTQ